MATGTCHEGPAHVTATRGPGGIIGFHSNRRHPHRHAIGVIGPMYQQMLRVERSAGSGPKAAQASADWLAGELAARQQTYEQFVWSLIHSDVASTGRAA